jgi:hypothetical protein
VQENHGTRVGIAHAIGDDANAARPMGRELF